MAPSATKKTASGKKTGLAEGLNKGHITTPKVQAPKTRKVSDEFQL
jgi:hypothetical protein